jgi:hypothetical protein
MPRGKVYKPFLKYEGSAIKASPPKFPTGMFITPVE